MTNCPRCGAEIPAGDVCVECEAPPQPTRQELPAWLPGLLVGLCAIALLVAGVIAYERFGLPLPIRRT